VLVLIGATEDGSKELLAVIEGYRESTQSWRELLGQLKRWVYRRRQAGHR
jgi:putative transposase